MERYIRKINCRTKSILAGDAKQPEQYKRTKTDITKLFNAWRQPFGEALLLDARLIGPVQIKCAQVIKQ